MQGSVLEEPLIPRKASLREHPAPNNTPSRLSPTTSASGQHTKLPKSPSRSKQVGPRKAERSGHVPGKALAATSSVAAFKHTLPGSLNSQQQRVRPHPTAFSKKACKKPIWSHPGEVSAGQGDSDATHVRSEKGQGAGKGSAVTEVGRARREPSLANYLSVALSDLFPAFSLAACSTISIGV
jgi:hypothetical protein